MRSGSTDTVSNVFFNQAPVGIMIIESASGEFHQANPSFCSLIGRRKRDVIGSTWMSITHPEDIAGELSCIHRIHTGVEEPLYHEKRFVHSDGNLIWAGVTFIRISRRNESGNARHIAVVQNLTYFRHVNLLLKETLMERDRAQEGIFNSMATLSEFRDNETGEHLLRTKTYVRLLLENRPYAHTFPRKAIKLISNAAMLHDIGKVGIADSILLKPGPLTPEEFTIMKSHTSLGVQALKQTGRKMEADHFFMFAEEIAGFHHERWDGSGYPLGLRKTEIPLPARVMAIADVYDALTSERPYKQAFSHEKALNIICENSETHFDPVLVALFHEIRNKFAEISVMPKNELERIIQLEE